MPEHGKIRNWVQIQNTNHVIRGNTFIDSKNAPKSVWRPGSAWWTGWWSCWPRIAGSGGSPRERRGS